MDTKKFEKLITLYLNEGNEEQARALFHDIIVEKSREIYESMLDVEEEAPVNDLMDEISMDETGMNEEDDEDEFGMDGSDMGGEDGLEDEGMEFGDDEMDADGGDLEDMGDMDDSDMEDMEGGEEGGEDLENRVVDIEDKLDQLMSEFEELMGGEGGDEEGAEDEEMAADDEEGAAADDEEEAADDDEEADDEEMMESVQLKKVAAPRHGDDGVNKKSIALSKPSVDTRGRGAVNFSGTGGSGRSAPSVKEVEGAGSFGNKAGGSSPKLSAVAKPKAGEQPKGRSPVAESKTTKRAVQPTAKRK
jgi:hypothetical protein